MSFCSVSPFLLILISTSTSGKKRHQPSFQSTSSDYPPLLTKKISPIYFHLRDDAMMCQILGSSDVLADGTATSRCGIWAEDVHKTTTRTTLLLEK